jgi:hypothetical protein
MMKMAKVIAVGMTMTLMVASTTIGSDDPEATTIVIFDDDNIRFDTENPSANARESITVLDNGRVIQTSVVLPVFTDAVRIEAHVAIKPIPKDEVSVHDKWDRAGSIRLVAEGQPDVEIVKFMTAYGGLTEWTVDVSHLAPLLKDTVGIVAFIDTWVSPAWRVDCSLEFTPDSTLPTYHWVQPLFFENSFNLETYADTGATIAADIPDVQQRVLLHYLVSGHCTDGRGADEFVKKDNVLTVDDVVVFRYQPWRDDCRQFREINPYTRRWSDGWWSSDYFRSGWCPGDIVTPEVLDLTDHLVPGTHDVGICIESIRPKDEDGNFGYWRVSAYLVGATDPE